MLQEHLLDVLAQTFNMKIEQPGGSGGGGVTGSGAATRVAYWTGGTTLGSDANLFFNPTTDLLSIGKPTPTYMLDVLEDINTDTFFRIDGNFVLGQDFTQKLLAVGSDARQILNAPLSSGANNLAIAVQSILPSATLTNTLIAGSNIPAQNSAGNIGTLTGSILLGYSSVNVNGLDNIIVDNTIVIGNESFTELGGDTYTDHIVIGSFSYTQSSGASGNLIIGHSTAISPGTSSNNIILGGANSFSDTDFAILLGNANTLTTTGHTSSVLIGHFGNLQSPNVIAIGGDPQAGPTEFGIFTMHLGRGEESRETNIETGVIYTATKAMDTDISGIDVRINGGQSTGTGTGGRVIIGTSKAGSTGSTLNSYNDVVSFDENGNIRASRLHNNTTSQGSSAEQDIRSGTYTPTLTNTTNVAASTPRIAQWLRVGNVVTVSGQLDIDPTSTGATLLGISLPVPSNFANAFSLGGTASSMTITNESAGIEADATNDRASLKYVAVDTTNHTMAYTFTYVVI